MTSKRLQAARLSPWDRWHDRQHSKPPLFQRSSAGLSNHLEQPWQIKASLSWSTSPTYQTQDPLLPTEYGESSVIAAHHQFTLSKQTLSSERSRVTFSCHVLLWVCVDHYLTLTLPDQSDNVSVFFVFFFLKKNQKRNTAHFPVFDHTKQYRWPNVW